MARGIPNDFPKIFIEGKTPKFDNDFKIDPSIFRMKVLKYPVTETIKIG